MPQVAIQYSEYVNAAETAYAGEGHAALPGKRLRCVSPLTPSHLAIFTSSDAEDIDAAANAAFPARAAMPGDPGGQRGDCFWQSAIQSVRD